MSTLLTRAPRALMFAVAAIFVMSLLAPLAAVANVDLKIGDQAAITNPNGSGANLRSDISTIDDSTVILELAQDTHVTIIDGPVVNDNGVWFRVLVADPIEGWVEASLLTKVETETTDPLANAPEAPAEAKPVSGLPWLEPIDSAVVVDDNAQLPAEGLAVRVSATVDGEVLGRAPVGSTLDVTEARTWVGEQTFVRVNFNGQGGYVNGNFVVLNSEVAAEPVAEEPVVEEPVAEEPVVQEPVVDEPVVDEQPVVEEPVAEEPVVEEPAAEQPAPADQATDEPVVDETVADAPEADAPVADAPADVTTSDDVPANDPVDEQITEEAPADVPAETDAPADVPAEDAVVEQPVVEEITDPATPPTENVTDPATPTAEDTTAVVEQPADAPQADAPVVENTTEKPVVEETTSEPATAESEDAVAEEPADAPITADATAEATEPVVEDTTPAVTTATAFDASTMIGSATVTGTTDGLRCRVAPDPDAATLMVLAEGTKVLVFAEPENGYLGIDCGGVQGYGDVAYLWSGGAVDANIPSANLTLTVSGTGNGLNCRTGAGLNYPVITVLPDGTTLTTRGSATNGWVGVTCGGQQGYVSVTWVNVKTSSDGSGSTGSGSSGSATSGTATVVNTNGDGLYCRSGAGTTFSVITVLSPGQTVSVRGANQGSWTPVTCGGANGYASSQYLSISAGTAAPAPSQPAPSQPAPTTGTVTVANTGGMGLNCRSGAGTSYPVITVLSLGQTVSTRSGSVSGWTAVVCGGKNGFIASEFTTSGGTAPTESEKPTTQEPAPQPSGMIKGDHAASTANVNLRYSASLSAGIATVVPDGTVVMITGGASNGFYPVDYDGLAGFMSGDYLVKTSAALSERGGSANPTTPSEPAPAPGGSATGSALVDYAMNYIGYPYVWATHGPSSFDCSGFTYWVVWNVLGINIGAGTWTQVSYGTPVGRNDVQPGDLIFHQNTYTAGLSHVGMYIGNGKMINALNENAGVVVTDITTSYWESRWYGARRL